VSIATAPAIYGSPSIVANVTDDELLIIRKLFDVWSKKYPRNVLRATYFDGKMALKPSGNIPREAMQKIDAVLGWPAKAVSVLAERSVLEGFVSPSGDTDPFDLSEILDANRFDIELPQAIEAAYEFSTSFITTASGDVQAEEPAVMVMARSAEWSAGIWDERRRRISAFMAISSVDDTTGQPQSVDVYLPDVVLMLTRRPSGAWVADRRPNPLNEVLVEALPCNPSLSKPFGRSRISRAVMNITDRALMNIVRTEISSDFYAAPRMYALGLAEGAFKNGKWQAAIDRWFAITRDANGDVPTVGQFPQMTMQPLTEHFKLCATQFSGETGVPVSNLGIITDNPPSAESLYADDRRLVSTALRQNKIFTASLRRVAARVVRLRDGGPVTDELRKLSVSWANPAFTSASASADAIFKLVQTFPKLAESTVALEYAGFTNEDITRIEADAKKVRGLQLIQSLAGGAPANQGAAAQVAAADAGTV